MRKLKFVFGRKSFQTIYVSFNRPLLEYADVVWDTVHSTKQTSLNIQTEAAYFNWGNKASIPKVSSLRNRMGHLSL